jgi:hypothetical protein
MPAVFSVATMLSLQARTGCSVFKKELVLSLFACVSILLHLLMQADKIILLVSLYPFIPRSDSNSVSLESWIYLTLVFYICLRYNPFSYNPQRPWNRYFCCPWFYKYKVTYSLWRTVSSGMLLHVALERTDVSEELSASFIRVTRIGELGTTLAVTNNRHTLRRNTKWEMKLEWNSELWMHGEGDER